MKNKHNYTFITKLKEYLVTFLLILLLFVLAITSLCVGRYGIPISEVMDVLFSKLTGTSPNVNSTVENVVLNLRLPRTIASILIGSSLALAGAAYQGIFKNPLVSPDILGVSSGAGLGASLAILLNVGIIGIQLFSFVGGIIAVTITALVPKLLKNSSTIILVLGGIIVNGVMTSLLGLTKYMMDTENKLAEITYWLMGSIAKVSKEDIILISIPMIISILLLLAIRWRVNILALGENEAKNLGVNTKLYRSVIIIFSTVLTACAVSISGTIGWVGLIVPHLGRMLIGPDNSRLFPLSLIIGGGFLLVIDTLSRTISSAELPISILTGLLGAPFYFWILNKQRMNLS
ncbi:iron ABC transporter permease [Cytobacillus solani]|uniref:FecCD family ABC transporter permease n=1 Tax=Cytobacillus solani TaxID=1637975 RepID=UPI00207AF03F|nr:iron ABC transporter permease [Cytobacillus solani]USK53737.1 iron ABC transporter permease [Cytobacillus solani]